MIRQLVLWIAVGTLLVACQKRDPLYCKLHLDDVTCAGDGGGSDVLPGYVVIGGTVTGKVGAGLVLQDNGGDDKLIVTNGPFEFATPILMSTGYAVTIGSQPSNPSQSCTIANGSGTADTNVDGVAVTCATTSYFVGGTLYGYNGAVTLQDNNGDDLPITANGAFHFATQVASGSTYSVSVKPGTGAGCTVNGGVGTVGNSDVSTIVVNCAVNMYTIGGTITGLVGMVMLGDGPSTITVSASSFSFAPVVNGSYTVSVTGQPAYPPAAQMCTVTSPNPVVVSGGNVTGVTVSCMTSRFTIGGNVSGLTGTVVLQDNGGDDRSITANGPFTFATSILSGNTYGVTVHTQPVGQVCTVTTGSGTVTGANITTVNVACVDTCTAATCASENGTCNLGVCDVTARDNQPVSCTAGEICAVDCPNDMKSCENGMTCGMTASCTYTCTADHTCDQNTTLSCSAGSTCAIYCKGGHSCNGLSIDCAAGATCTYHCCGNHACGSLTCTGAGCTNGAPVCP